MLLQEINSPWAISLSNSREIVQGVAAIRQRIWIALGTTKGSDPLRPYFGTNIYKNIDLPSQVASANIKKEIIDSISLWVPEVKLERIKDIFFTPQTSETKNYGIRFEITYLINEAPDRVFFNLENGTISWDGMQSITLTDVIPAGGFRINVALTLNGNTSTPIAPIEGFSTGTELYTWITANWAQYGTWAIFEDRVILYSNVGTTSGSLNIYAMVGGDFNEDFNDDFNNG